MLLPLTEHSPGTAKRTAQSFNPRTALNAQILSHQKLPEHSQICTHACTFFLLVQEHLVLPSSPVGLSVD